MTATPRRIAFLLGHGEWGGIERHVFALARNLDPARWRPHVVFLFRGGPVAEAMKRAEIPVAVLDAKNGHDPHLLQQFPGFFRQAGPFSLIHSHELHLIPALVMRWSMRLRHIPWVHTEHCSLTHGPSPVRARLAWHAAAPRIARVIGVSRATCDQLIKGVHLDPAKCRHIYNGIDFDDLPVGNPASFRATLGLHPDTLLIGSVGRLAAQKDWDAFIQTAVFIAHDLPEAHFIITGDGPDRARLETLARQVDLESRVHFLGSRDDARAIIGALDLFLTTSLHEELPTTLIEAFAMRTPVAGFIPEGGVSEILTMTEPRPFVAVSGRNARDLATACLELVANPANRLAMLDTAEQLARGSFSMKHIADEVQSVYDETVSPPGP